MDSGRVNRSNLTSTHISPNQIDDTDSQQRVSQTSASPTQGLKKPSELSDEELSARTVTHSTSNESFLAHALAKHNNRPTKGQQFDMHLLVARQRIVQHERNGSTPKAAGFTMTPNGFEVQRGAPEQPISEAFIEQQLAVEVPHEDSNWIKVEFIYPRNLASQLERAERALNKPTTEGSVTMTTGSTPGSTDIPPSAATATQRVEPQESVGETSSAKKVTKAEVENKIPRTRTYKKGVPLKARKAVTVKTSDTPFATLKAFVLQRPKPSQIAETKALAENIAETLGSDTCTLTITNRKVTVNRDSDEHKAMILLVESGLATIDVRADETITFKLVRPENLTLQVKLANLLCENVPVELSPLSGKMNWGVILDQTMEPHASNSLLISGLVVSAVPSGYKVNTASKARISRFENMQRQHEIKGNKPSAYWQARLEELSGIFHEELSSDLLRYKDSLKNSRLDTHQLSEKADAVRKEGYETLAVELEEAFKDLSGKSSNTAKPAATPTPVKSREVTPEQLKDWNSVLPELRKTGLMKPRLSAEEANQLAQDHNKNFPFDLTELVRHAKLWAKEQELVNDYEALDFNRGSILNERKLEAAARKKLEVGDSDFEAIIDKRKRPTITKRQLQGKQQQYNKTCQKVRGLFDQLKSTNPAPSIEEMSAKLLEQEPVETLNYDDKHWQLAYRNMNE